MKLSQTILILVMLATLAACGVKGDPIPPSEYPSPSPSSSPHP